MAALLCGLTVAERDRPDWPGCSRSVQNADLVCMRIRQPRRTVPLQITRFGEQGGGPLPITSSRMGCLLDALAPVYDALGLGAAVGD